MLACVEITRQAMIDSKDESASGLGRGVAKAGADGNGDVNDKAGENPLSGFDLRTPEKTKEVGHELVDELLELDDRYPAAAEAKNEAGGRVGPFLEVVDISDEPRTERLARERIRWLHEALDAWIKFTLNTGVARDEEVFEVCERIDIGLDDEM